MKLGLGTVQFGMNYGVSNTSGQTVGETAQQILAFAADNKIEVLDTAPLYGTSESVIGSALTDTQNKFKIITKTNKIQKTHIQAIDVEAVLETFSQSLIKLNQKKVYGLLLHQTADLLNVGGERLYDALIKLKQDGFIDKIGISVYHENEIDAVLDKYAIDLVQLPLNIFDQRFLRRGYLQRLKSANIEVHVRSLFLQGLMLMKLQDIPTYFAPVLPLFEKYHSFLAAQHISPLEAAIGFVSGLNEVDIAICGVNNLTHLQELLTARHVFDANMFDEFQLVDENYFNPSQWRL